MEWSVTHCVLAADVEAFSVAVLPTVWVEDGVSGRCTLGCERVFKPGAGTVRTIVTSDETSGSQQVRVMVQ